MVAAGRKFHNWRTNSIGELLLATPALSGGAMSVCSARSVFAVVAPTTGNTLALRQPGKLL